MHTEARVVAALMPVVAGTAFERALEAWERHQPAAGRSTYLLLCVATPEFRERHPSAPEAVDFDHPDGCTDLIVEVDAAGRLARAEVEILSLADDLVGQPVDDALPAVAARLGELLHRDDAA